jgi:hypothetical protein
MLARQADPDAVLTLEDHGRSFRPADGGLSHLETGRKLLEISGSYKRTAGFDPDILNRRSSLSVR